MPIEYALLAGEPEPLEFCPQCSNPFRAFMRGHVQSYWRRVFRLPYCCLICWQCKEVVGYERPDVTRIFLNRIKAIENHLHDKFGEAP